MSTKYETDTLRHLASIDQKLTQLLAIVARLVRDPDGDTYTVEAAADIPWEGQTCAKCGWTYMRGAAHVCPEGKPYRRAIPGLNDGMDG
jgi:hypothetical protein